MDSHNNRLIPDHSRIENLGEIEITAEVITHKNTPER